VNTRRGLYVSLAMQQGFDAWGAGYRYLRFFPEVRGFLALGPSMVLAARARFGALVPVGEQDNPPPVALFYGGGPASIRGYNTRQYAPLQDFDNDKVWEPLGANGLADASLELRFDLRGSWGGAVFLDGAGVSSFSSSDTEFLKALDLSAQSSQLVAGLSLRYRTQFGALRLDTGVRLPTNFSKGVPFDDRFPHAPHTPGHREPIVAVHLLLGEAF
jgi:translocation and assembly module TamA